MSATTPGFDLGPALLFCPADRPERYAKALERADAVIIDLEDAVAPRDKIHARAALLANPVDPARVIVRINGFDSPWFEEDVATLRLTDYRTVMLPKTTSVAQVRPLHGWDVIALCETAAGVIAAPEVAAFDNVVALFWGAEDLVVSLGGTSSRFADGRYRDVARVARASVLLAAGAAGKAAIDSVYTNIPDLAGLAAEVEDAAASGFTATACIHPSQVDTIRSAYRPSGSEVERARRLMALAESSPGAFAFEGQMVDEPLLQHARTLLARSGA